MRGMRTGSPGSRCRLAALGAATAVLALVVSGSAVAGELLILGSKSKPDLEYFAAKNERNDVHVSDSRAGYVIEDLGANIKSSASSCKRSADRHKVTCPHRIRRGGPLRKPAFLNIVLGNGNDLVTVSSKVTVAVMLFGDAGDDRIYAGGGADTVYGKDGDDYIDGRGGRDTISGGLGDDIIISNDGVKDVVKCGPGTDRVEADHLDDVAADCERAET